MKKALFAIFTAAFLFAGTAKAYTYDLSGLSLFVVNPEEQVTVSFLSRDVSYTHLLGSNLTTGTLINSGNPSSSAIDLGLFTAGTEIIFDLYVNNTEKTFSLVVLLEMLMAWCMQVLIRLFLATILWRLDLKICY